MKCKNCNSVIPDDVLCCPYCDTYVDDEIDNLNNLNTMNNLSNMNNAQVVQQKQVLSVNNNKTSETNYVDNLIGKKYTFKSPLGMNLLTFSIYDSYIKSQVEIAKDRIFIDVKPKRKNIAPVVITEDILSIQLSKSISVYHVILALISVVAALASPVTLLLTAASIYFGLYTKIKIIQKNGVSVVMFSTDSATAENFRQDIKRMVNIR